MSAVGFTSQSKDQELEKLREAWRSLSDVKRNIARAQASLEKRDLKLVKAHLDVALWNIGQVKKSIAFVGQAKSEEANK